MGIITIFILIRIDMACRWPVDELVEFELAQIVLSEAGFLHFILSYFSFDFVEPKHFDTLHLKI